LHQGKRKREKQPLILHFPSKGFFNPLNDIIALNQKCLKRLKGWKVKKEDKYHN
jgi:hypothetical protein